VNVRLWIAAALVFASTVLAAQHADLPELTQPVNDFAHIIDAASAERLDQMIRRLRDATGDVVVVVAVPTIEPYGDVKEYANKLFENHGRGIGEKGKDNGVLILVAVKERKVWIEVGYGLEPFITDGFSGETSRLYMAPEFREGRYGPGLVIGTERIVGRIAQARNVTLDGVRVPRAAPQSSNGSAMAIGVIILIIVVALIVARAGSGPQTRVRRWGGREWSGWSSGVGSFGGGSSGGGGGGSSW